MTADTIATRRTYDGATVRVLASGDLVDGALRTFTRHRPLDVPTALLVAEEAMLFDAAEIPALIEAAHRLARRSPCGVLPGALRALASRLSTRAGTRPADAPTGLPGPSKAARRAATRGTLADHVRWGCRRIRCPVCG
jgi:hypothetical protein